MRRRDRELIKKLYLSSLKASGVSDDVVTGTMGFANSIKSVIVVVAKAFKSESFRSNQSFDKAKRFIDFDSSSSRNLPLEFLDL